MTIIQMSGGWTVTDYGLEHESGYAIAAEELWESDWISHMDGKQWVKIEDFVLALEAGRVHFYGLSDFWPEFSKERYTEYVKSDRWKELREIVLKRCNHQCQNCLNTKWLQMHHRTYERVGHELLTDLTILCRRCHTRQHRKW